jgi:hypothetical protein
VVRCLKTYAYKTHKLNGRFHFGHHGVLVDTLGADKLGVDVHFGQLEDYIELMMMKTPISQIALRGPLI